MIVDAHVHVLPDALIERRDEIARGDAWFAACHDGGRHIATVDELLTAMDEAGVERAVCFGWPFADSQLLVQVNDHLAGAQRAHPDRLVAFGCVNPADMGAVHELRRIADMGLHGVGELNSDAQGFSLDAGRVDDVAAVSAALGLPWTLHCSEPLGHAYAGKGMATPEKIAGFVQRNPELQLICAHLGGGLPFYAHMPEIAQLCRTVWFDTAALPFLYEPSAYRTVIDLVGADRLLLGSDYPLLPVERYRRGLDAAGLSQSERRQVMGDTAQALLDL
ncbi:MAG: amidohydrolase family protein [Candidatus Dormibacteria bacterium]